ncbi:MAG: acetolactate synthase large subunit [Solirubrobacterales bacterium]|nr:acetolactate synthase large subunit [Solirubrobacterales bacterium]
MTHPYTVARLIVRCLENEGVEYVFGIPGEENIHLVDALVGSRIRFITVRDERGAAFMADTYGRLTGRAGVCLATLGPGAINLALGTANAHLDSHPLVALVAQAGLDRLYKESHQVVDLVALYRPITKWAATLTRPESAAEMVRKAFKQAQAERPGAALLAVPEDVAPLEVSGEPLPVRQPVGGAPPDGQVVRAVELLNGARAPVVLAGAGASRDRCSAALLRFAERLNVPVATTFLGKGVFPDGHANALGTLGFMKHDYANFGFDQADLVITVGYDLVEYPPARWCPNRDKKILHLHRTVAEVDASYPVTVGIESSLSEALDAIAARAEPKRALPAVVGRARGLLAEELERGRRDPSFPVKPQRLVADIRAALGQADIVLADTGAVKMWLARLYPCYQPETCLVSNGLATMAFALPGAIAAKLAHPQCKVLAAVGDGAFLMSSQELETAVRQRIPLVVLVWVDGAYGLIKWKMDLELGHHSAVDFRNPDFVKYAESFGARGYRIEAAEELLPTLRKALADDAVSVIACPVDYSENIRLTDKLGKLEASNA